MKELYDLSNEDVAKAQKAKNEKSGAFKKGLHIDYVEVSEDHPWIYYFRKNVDRYPEIK